MARSTTATKQRAGYVYVLATAHRSGTGLPIVKVGMTTRTPEKRALELSRGGPVGMILEGFVSAQDAVGLERAAHQHFQAVRVAAGGGTEYFSVLPSEILAWLRSTSPRFELESARQGAWQEYCASIPFKRYAHISLIPLFTSGVCFWVGIFWHPYKWWIVVLGGPAGFVLGLLFVGLFLRPELKRLDAQKASLRTQLEEKYHLPSGGVRYR